MRTHDLSMSPDDLQKYTICGYPIKDLVIFADACQKNDVTFSTMHEFALNVGKAHDYALDIIRSELIEQLAKLRRDK